MPNFTRTILVALILGEEDDAILILNSSDNTLFFFSIFTPILRHFGSISIHIASVRLFCYFCVVNPYLFSLSKLFSRPVAWTFVIVADIFFRSFFLDYQQQMTSDNIVRQQIPVCIIFGVLCTKLKVRFYCENEVFLPLFFTQMILQFPCF